MSNPEIVRSLRVRNRDLRFENGRWKNRHASGKDSSLPLDVEAT